MIWSLEGYAKVTFGHFQRYSAAALGPVPPQAHHRILDVGCGPGTLITAVALKVADVTALDFFANMIGRCKERLAAQGLDHVDAVKGDGQNRLFEAEVFSAVLRCSD